MGEILPFASSPREEMARRNRAQERKTEKFKIYYDYGNFKTPGYLLAMFVHEHNLVMNEDRSYNFEVGDFDIALRWLENGDMVYANFRYDGSDFDITREHPQGREVTDLFFDYLSENKVPWNKR